MPPRKQTSLTQKIPPPSEEDAEESDASEDMTDPEDDIDASEFECVHEAARDRTAPRTRRQYDLFVGLMKNFFLELLKILGLKITYKVYLDNL